jgi:hypothetical protein
MKMHSNEKKAKAIFSTALAGAGLSVTGGIGAVVAGGMGSTAALYGGAAILGGGGGFLLAGALGYGAKRLWDKFQEGRARKNFNKASLARETKRRLFGAV